MLHRRSKGNYRQWLLVSCLVIFGSVLSAAFLPNMPVYAAPCVASQPGCKCINLGTTQSCSWVEPTDTTTPGPVTPADCDVDHQSATCVCQPTPGDTASAQRYTCIDPSTSSSAISACAKYTNAAENAACMEGYANAATKDYCTTKNYGPAQAALLAACQDGSTARLTGTTTTTTTKDPIVCTGGALGWLLCPVAKIFNEINKAMATEIQKQLEIRPLVSTEAMYTGTHPIWSVMVGFANLVLVIAFLIVIFSQATSLGLSAYGIKKMLPRIIAAAVLINLSYFICGIAVDISNIIGAAVQGIIKLGLDNVKVAGFSAPDFGTGLGSISLAVLGIGAAVVTGAVAYIVPLALIVVLSTMVVFLGLAARKIIVVLLIIIAPLAFAAMILPGTEGLFKKWQKSFIGILALYPAIMAILYGSLLVAQIILATGDGANASKLLGQSDASSITLDPTTNVSSVGLIPAIIAYAIIGLGPFVGTYMFIKSQSKIFSAIAGGVNKAGSPFKKLANGVASKSQARSLGSQLLRTHDNVADTAAQRKMINRYQKGGLSSKLATAFQGPEAHRAFAAQIDKAHEDLRNAEVTATRNNVGVSAAKLHADGAYWDQASSSFRQGNGSALTKEQTEDQATMKGLEYLRDNGMIATSRGGKSSTNAMRASMATLAESGALDRGRAESAIAQVDEKDRMAFMENLDNVARSAGLTHMGYAGVRKDGSIDWAARKTDKNGVPQDELVAQSIVDAGIHKQSKYVMGDKTFHPALRTALNNHYANNETQFWSDMAASGADQLDGAITAMTDKATGKISLGGSELTRDEFLEYVKLAKPKTNS